jgi:hypothetical protein
MDEREQLPRRAKAHSATVAAEYLKMGWTLVSEFRVPGDPEPYEYYFEWKKDGPPKLMDWERFRREQIEAKAAGKSQEPVEPPNG